MTSQYPPKQTALEAYEANQAKIQKLLQEIKAGLEAHDKNCHPRHHWGHVGDLTYIATELQEINNRLHRVGEYAEVAT